MNQLHEKESTGKRKKWILKLQTVFLYGLNDSLGDHFIKEDTHALVGSKFPAQPRNSTRMFWSQVHKLNTTFSFFN